MPRSEDCLYLNVITPAKDDTERLPVMVWMHGGGLYSGSGNRPYHNSEYLPRQGVVVVTVNKRLGPMGLLAHPLLSEESENDVSGNYMFLDIIAALKWVQRNIAFFGGDPDNVTVFGESGGGSKVTGLMASPLAKGLFHGLICENGGFPHGAPLKKLEEIGEKLFAILGVDKESDPLAAARAKIWEDIIKAGQELNRHVWTTAVDGWFMPASPIDVIREGRHNDVPVIFGANMGELTGPGVTFKTMIPIYLDVFSGVKKMNRKGFAYIFDQVPEGWRNQGVVSFHTLELCYVFGDPVYETPDDWSHTAMFGKGAGVKDWNPGLTDIDRAIADNMMSMWAQFAKTKDPNVEGLIDWPECEHDGDKYLYINKSFKVKSGFSKVPE